FRRVLHVGPSATRVAVAVAALATVPLGRVTPAFVQLAGLALIVAGMLWSESARWSPVATQD
ncbi:MAG: hypothetical protein ACRD0W_04520, partial [Acidimicrobiales bacterium]